MKLKNNFTKASRKMWSFKTLLTKSLFVSVLLIASMQITVQAQQYSKPSWYFGVVGAANVNFFDGSTRQLNAQFTSPVTFHKGRGIGVYAGGVIQYRPATSVLGFMLQGGYDSRIEQILYENPDLPILIVDAGKSVESGGKYIVYTIRTGVCWVSAGARFN